MPPAPPRSAPPAPGATNISFAGVEFSTHGRQADDTFDFHTASVGTEIPSTTLSLAAALSHSLGTDGDGRGPDDSPLSLGSGGDGSVLTWGDDDPARLGQGAVTIRARASNGSAERGPDSVEEPGPGRIVAVHAGAEFSVALRSDGTVWTWGVNSLGQLGDGSVEDRASAERVVGLDDIVAIASGEAHTLALARDGSVWAWGRNERGQLGTAASDLCSSDIPCSRTPVQVVGVNRAFGIAAGGNSSLALVQDDR